MTTPGSHPHSSRDSALPELGPDLEVVRLLGSGSTADVFLAREEGLRRLVAVKMLRRELVEDAVLLRRFEREAQAIAQLTHPHVTAIHRIGHSSGVPYLVLEYIDGRTVADLLATGPLPNEREVLAAVADALAAAHEHGIVHRDVRPGNVYIENRTGRAVLGDFGIAALLDSGSGPGTRLTRAGARIGELRYLSPEQIQDGRAVEQSDIYAFGVLAYELLTGAGPYVAATEPQLLDAHMRQRPKPLSDLRPDLDAGVVALLEGCLAKDPNRRPRARELSSRLRPGGDASRQPAEDLAPLDQFLAELRRRRVYQVLVTYGAFAAAVLGTMQAVYDAFDLTPRTYQLVVVATLAGLPVALVLGWAYDITSSGIRRTSSDSISSRLRLLMALGLAGSVAAAALVAWLMLRAA